MPNTFLIYDMSTTRPSSFVAISALDFLTNFDCRFQPNQTLHVQGNYVNIQSRFKYYYSLGVNSFSNFFFVLFVQLCLPVFVNLFIIIFQFQCIILYHIKYTNTYVSLLHNSPDQLKAQPTLTTGSIRNTVMLATAI